MHIWHRDGCYKLDWFGSGFIYARQTKPNYMWADEKKNCDAQPFSPDGSPDLSATSWLKVFISSVISCFSSF